MADKSSGKSTSTRENETFEFLINSENMIQVMNLLWNLKKIPNKNPLYKLTIVSTNGKEVTTDQIKTDTDCGNHISKKKEVKENEDGREVQKHEEMIKSISLLLIGEQGSGKTTFINGLANYLKYESIDEVKSQGVVVKLSTSFNIFSNNQKRCIKLVGDQSDLHEITECTLEYEDLVLKIIDTPGPCEENQECLQKIKDFVSKNQIDAILWLFKPNEVKYNFFQQFFNIITLANPKVYLFGFTHSRQTFFKPGDTYILLKKHLKDSNKNYALNVDNIYTCENNWLRCFTDSTESGDGEDVTETSWTNSWNEMTRMMRYLKNHC